MVQYDIDRSRLQFAPGSQISNLELNEQQATQVKAINLDFAQQMQAAHSEAQGDREAMQTTRDNLRNGRNEALKGVLTEAQFQKFTTMQQQKGKQGQKGKNKQMKGKQKKGGKNANY